MTLFAHISETDLALHAGGDLSGLQVLKTKAHLAGCPYCRIRLERYLECRDTLSDAAVRMPADVDWESLSAEMTANIHLGLAAGEVVRRNGKPDARQAVPAAAGMFQWQYGAVCASLALVLTSVWMLDTGRRKAEPAPVRAVLALPAGAEVQAVDFDGGERARQLDNETGQVTITQVYAD